MTITAVVNCCTQFLYDKICDFFQAADDHVGTLFEKTLKINSHWVRSKNNYNFCKKMNVCTMLHPINFHNCTKSLLWRGNVTHRRPHTYPMQWHLHSQCVCNTNFGRTTAQSRFYVHPKTVSFLILFRNKFSLLYAIQYKCQPKVPELLCFWRNLFAWKHQAF